MVSRLALLVPLVAMVLFPPLSQSSQRPDNDHYRDPRFYTLYTTIPPILLSRVPFLVLNYQFLNTSFVYARGFVELPILDPILEFQETSLLYLILQPGLRYFVVRVSSSDVVLRISQTMHNVMHLIASCLPHGFYLSIYDQDPTEFH